MYKESWRLSSWSLLHEVEDATRVVPLTCLPWGWSRRWSVLLISIECVWRTRRVSPWLVWHEVEGIATVDSWEGFKFSVVTTAEINDLVCWSTVEAGGEGWKYHRWFYTFRRDTVVLRTIYKGEKATRNCTWIKWIHPCCSHDWFLGYLPTPFQLRNVGM
jgi:hypothetical protein